MKNELFDSDVQSLSAASLFKMAMFKGEGDKIKNPELFAKYESIAKEILELAGEAIVVCDVTGVIVLANRKAKFLFGKDLVSKNFDEAISIVAEGDGVRISIHESFREDMTSGIEAVHISDNDVKSNVIFKTGLIRGKGDRPVGCVVTLTDITERKQAEKRLGEALTAKSRFTAMVSHELKSPLSVIKEGIMTVKDGLAGSINDSQQKFLGLSLKAAERLKVLINDILDFERLGAGKMVFKIEAGDIGELICDVAASMETLAQKRGLEIIKIKAAKNLPKARFDRDRIYQVLSNLVGNAIKYTKKGRITIETLKEGDEIHVLVHDTGRGIKKEDMPKLFSEFERIEETFSDERGTGLGLVISKNIVEKQGGSMWASSEYGKGSTFGFTLPAVAKKNKKRKK